MFSFLIFTGLLLKVEGNPVHVAMILEVSGRVRVESAKGKVVEASPMKILFPNDRLVTDKEGQVIIVFIKSKRREQVGEKQEVTVHAAGCAPDSGVKQLPPVKNEVFEDGIDFDVDPRGAIRPFRSEKPADPPPNVSPMPGTKVLSDRPSFAWLSEPKAAAYQVELVLAGRRVWSARVKEPTLVYPAKETPLPRGRKYEWRVVAEFGPDSTRPLLKSEFNVADNAEVKQLEDLKGLLGSDSPADLLLAALGYQSAGVFEEALGVYERLSKLRPKEPVFMEARAEFYERAGRLDEAKKAWKVAKDLKSVGPDAPERIDYVSLHRKVEAFVKAQGKTIAFFALPTYEYLSIGIDETKQLRTGCEVVCTLEVKSKVRVAQTVQLSLVFDNEGRFDFLKVTRESTVWTPFGNAVGEPHLRKQREFLSAKVKDNPDLLREVENANPKKLCELFLRLENSAAPELARTNLHQVHPAPSNSGQVERSRDQTRAIVLVHGLRPETRAVLVAEPRLAEWQQPGTGLVKSLGQEGDVFAFGYGQDTSIAEVAPVMKSGIECLLRARYKEIVLIGHNASGLVVRQFVEDFPDAGVTKVIQLSTPNGGYTWGRLKPTVTVSQELFVESLGKEARERALRLRPKKVIPASVEFVSVVTVSNLNSDGILSCESQWTEDLREQRIPVSVVSSPHSDIVKTAANAKLICTLVREHQPRLSPQQVAMVRQLLSGK